MQLTLKKQLAKAIKLLNIVVILFLCSCAKRPNPNYSIDTNSRWHTVSTNKVIKADYRDNNYRSEWWKNFHDCTLNNLIIIAIRNNPNFQIAQLRIKEARANAIKANANLAPEINMTKSSSVAKKNFTTTGTTFSPKKAITLSTVALEASWEPDFFGVNRNLRDAEQHKLFATIAGRNHFLITLIADVAANYIEYRKYQQLLKINEENVKSQLDILNMIKSRQKSGIESDFEVRRARAIYLTTKAMSHEFNYKRLQAQYRIETLCGVLIGDFTRLLKEKKAVPTINTQIIANSPLYIIRNRPDIIQAEEEFIAATSLTKSAIASQYPQITLATSVGYKISNLLPDQLIWSVGASSITPLINFNRIKANIDIRTAQEEQSFLHYKQTIREALEEIESAFVKYISYHNNYLELKNLVENNNKSLQLSKDLYNSSTVAYTRVLETEKDVYESEMEKIESLAEYSKSAIALYKVLGYCT